MLEYDWDKKSLVTTDAEMVSFLSEGYRQERYLADVPDDALNARLGGLLASIVSLSYDCELGFRVRNDADAIAFAAILEEFRLRDIDPGNRVAKFLERFRKPLRFSNGAGVKDVLSSLAGHKCLFKFTERKYVNSILRGEIRFKTASSYNRAGYSIAIKDEELSIEHILPNLRITTQDGNAIPVRDHRLTVRAAADYYVSCFCASCEPKLFVLFEEYDACVAIIDADAFVQSVAKAYKAAYPTFTVCFGNVEYVDPFRQLRSRKPIEFRKSRNFAYERECRFVSFPVEHSDYHEEVQRVSVQKHGFEYAVVVAD